MTAQAAGDKATQVEQAVNVYINLPPPAPEPDKFNKRAQIATILVAALSPIATLLGPAIPALNPDQPEQTIVYITPQQAPDQQEGAE
jgi:hypothetical protein